MDLSDSEKRDLIKLIENNKPIPEQYKFRLFEKSSEIELLWNGKNNEVTNVNLPFQIIENVDEPRKNIEPQLQGNLFDDRGRKLSGWTNKLIWGNNSLVLSSLINGNLRDEIEKQGGLKLVYIDPPFNVGDDFELEIEVGKEILSKKRNALEQLAFSDTWGKGEDSFLSMIYERLKLIHSLLHEDGLVFVHCDWRLNSSLRLVLDEIFGNKCFKNEVHIKRKTKNIQSQFSEVRMLNIAFDSVFIYSKNENKKIRVPKKKLKEINFEGKWNNFWNNADRPTLRYDLLGISLKTGQWRWKKEKALEAVENYKEYLLKHNNLTLSEYWEKTGKIKRFIRRKEGATRCYYWVSPTDETTVDTDWSDFYGYDNSQAYPTAKSENLLNRIIENFSSENDLIGDFFSGSGTTLVVAEKLNRKWIGCDLGKFAIHTARKRLIQVQRDKEQIRENFRPFEVLNLGKYQREFFFKDYLYNERNIKNEQSEQHYYDLILNAYKAKQEKGYIILKGVKNNRAVAVGPFNLQVTRLFVENVINECLENKILAVDILGFEFEMGLFPNIRDVAGKKGVDLNCLYIPNDIFDKKAVKKHQIIFYNTAFIDAQIVTKKKEFCIKLKGYVIFDSDTLFEEALSELDKGEKREILMKNSIIKIEKDKEGKIKKQVIKMEWSSWVDYWSVDFDFENKKEIIREDGVEKWTNDYIFENEWQSFRTQKIDIEFETPYRKIIKGKKIAVKVIDIFGNDTMKILEI